MATFPNWKRLHPRATSDMLGYLPGMLDEDDPRPARAQLNSNYVAGWTPFEGFTMGLDGNLQYPGDPPTLAIAECKLRNEIVRLYQHAWVAIIQKDGSFEVCRMD